MVSAPPRGSGSFPGQLHLLNAGACPEIQEVQKGNKKQQKALKSFDFKAFGGDKRDRTADLLNAIQALSQLSYTPVFFSPLARGKTYNSRRGQLCQGLFFTFFIFFCAAAAAQPIIVSKACSMRRAVRWMPRRIIRS